MMMKVLRYCIFCENSAIFCHVGVYMTPL